MNGMQGQGAWAAWPQACGKRLGRERWGHEGHRKGDRLCSLACVEPVRGTRAHTHLAWASGNIFLHPGATYLLAFPPPTLSISMLGLVEREILKGQLLWHFWSEKDQKNSQCPIFSSGPFKKTIILFLWVHIVTPSLFCVWSNNWTQNCTAEEVNQNTLQSSWPLRNLKSTSMSGINNSIQNEHKVISGCSWWNPL